MEHAKQVRLIKEMLARLDAGSNVDAGGLRRNPTSVYVDPDLAGAEWAAFFQDHPQILGLSGDLPEPGSFLTVDELGLPILATRDGAGEFRAFVNACRHRGAVVEERERGTARRFTCAFHHWTYDSDGSLVGVTKPDHFGNLDLSCHGLLELPAVEAHGLLFVHPNPNGAIDVESMLGHDLAEELESWDLGALEFLGQDRYDVACNWKLAMDTFGETYHFPFLHRDTINLGFHGNVQCYDTFGRNHRMLLCQRAIDEMRLLPEAQWDLTVATLPAYWLFPNVQLLPSHGGCFLVRAYPIPGDPGRQVSRITFYLRQGAESPIDAPGVEEQRSVAELFASIIRDEDYVMSASQQRTAASGVLEFSTFGRNEPALHHYHSTYRAALGLPPLPLLDDHLPR